MMKRLRNTISDNRNKNGARMEQKTALRHTQNKLFFLLFFKSLFVQALRFFYYERPFSTCCFFIGKQEIFIFIFYKTYTSTNLNDPILIYKIILVAKFWINFVYSLLAFLH